MFLYRILFVCTYFLTVSHGQHISRYSIPTPTIQAFNPRGFRVSIEDAPGIRLFAFHANINREVKDLEAGAIAGDVVNAKNGRWVFKDRRTRLQVGDVIHYWLFVIKDGLGYRVDRKSFVVEELIPKINNGGHRHIYDGNNSNTCNETSGSDSSESDMASNLKVCEQTILNVTQVLINLHTEISRIERENNQLTNFLERIPNSKMLTLSGRIPPDDEPLSTVSFILREKLLLNPIITSAVRNSPMNITFEVGTIFEKIEILNVAKEKLNTSRIIIS